MSRIVPLALAGLMMVAAQQPPAQSPGQPPAFDRASDALEKVTWRTRTLVGDERLMQWKLAVRPEGVPFLDAIVRADALVVDYVEASNTQPVSKAIAKPLDAKLTSDEIAAIKQKMGTIKLLAYRVDTLPADVAARK